MAPRRPHMASEGRKSAGHGQKSAATRDAAIVALLSSRTVQQAAERAGIGERTLRRWLAIDNAFRADYAAARRAALETALGRIQTLTESAVEALEELLAPRIPPAVRLGAARVVMDVGVHERDVENILQRLAALERAALEASR